jgi:hypothetical protein
MSSGVAGRAAECESVGRAATVLAKYDRKRPQGAARIPTTTEPPHRANGRGRGTGNGGSDARRA